MDINQTENNCYCHYGFVFEFRRTMRIMWEEARIESRTKLETATNIAINHSICNDHIADKNL